MVEGDDWSGNNERLWRTQEAGSLWRWIGNDFDDIFEDLGKDSYLHATRGWLGRLAKSRVVNKAFSKFDE